MNVLEDIRAVSELKAQTRKLLAEVRASGRPMVITVKGKPCVVLVDAADFERRERALALAGQLARGEEDIRAGRTRPAREFLKELGGAKRRKRKIRR
jgi:prevent-host-death family protein